MTTKPNEFNDFAFSGSDADITTATDWVEMVDKSMEAANDNLGSDPVADYALNTAGDIYGALDAADPADAFADPIFGVI